VNGSKKKMTREKWLEKLFDFYMHKPSFEDGACIKTTPTLNWNWDGYQSRCKKCMKYFNFRYEQHCTDISDKWYKQKIINILRKEGYID
jgi:hypothetical protein